MHHLKENIDTKMRTNKDQIENLRNSMEFNFVSLFDAIKSMKDEMVKIK